MGLRTWHDNSPHGSPAPQCFSTFFLQKGLGWEESGDPTALRLPPPRQETSRFYEEPT